LIADSHRKKKDAAIRIQKGAEEKLEKEIAQTKKEI
jgi:hypothetical protein